MDLACDCPAWQELVQVSFTSRPLPANMQTHSCLTACWPVLCRQFGRLNDSCNFCSDLSRTYTYHLNIWPPSGLPLATIYHLFGGRHTNPLVVSATKTFTAPSYSRPRQTIPSGRVSASSGVLARTRSCLLAYSGTHGHCLGQHWIIRT